jgi:hypothetical protein
MFDVYDMGCNGKFKFEFKYHRRWKYMLKPPINEDGGYNKPSDEMIEQINNVYNNFGHLQYDYNQLIEYILQNPLNIISDFIIKNNIIEDVKNTMIINCTKTHKMVNIKTAIEENTITTDEAEHMMKKHIVQIIHKIQECVEYSTNVLKIVDKRYISQIGSRVVYIDHIFDNGDRYNKTEWILVTVCQ